MTENCRTKSIGLTHQDAGNNLNLGGSSRSSKSTCRFSNRVNTQIFQGLNNPGTRNYFPDSDSDESLDDLKGRIPKGRHDQASSITRFSIVVFFLTPKTLYKPLDGDDSISLYHGDFVIRYIECLFNQSTNIEDLVNLAIMEINKSLREENSQKQLLLDDEYQLRMSKKRGTADFDSPGNPS